MFYFETDVIFSFLSSSTNKNDTKIMKRTVRKISLIKIPVFGSLKITSPVQEITNN